MRQRVMIFDDRVSPLVCWGDDPREGPDSEFADPSDETCPDHGDCLFSCCCGVTRCVYCRRVVA